MAGEEYPALAPSASWQERMEKRMADMEKEIADQKVEVKTQKDILFGFCERDVIIIAGEILKWAVQKRGEIDGEGRQFFDSDPTIQRMVFVSFFLTLL